MPGLSLRNHAGTMTCRMERRMCVAVLDTSRFDESSSAREFVSVSTVNLSLGSGAGKSFE